MTDREAERSETAMKMISWNVNGLRAVMQKGFMEAFAELDADLFCLQETKLQEGQIEMDLPGYHQYWNYAEKKGYSGTAVFSRQEPLSVRKGIGVEEFDHEGRVITLEFPEFWFITVYTPNSQDELQRLPYRMQWEDAFLAYIQRLDQEKPVIFCGDLNVAHRALLENGFVDTFRYFHPEEKDAYSWWSYRFHAREKNAGWRIDYFIVSERLKDRLTAACIHPEVFGSDHCPVELQIGLG